MPISTSNSPTSAAPANPHLTDALLEPFLAPMFSPSNYLNSTLPSLPPSTIKSTTASLPSLAALTTQTQSQISSLNAQTARLSATLTALTDDILRCSSRLAYEVELLRGEAGGLVEVLDEESESPDSVGAAMKKFMPSLVEQGDRFDAVGEEPKPPVKPQIVSETVTTKESLDNLKTLLHVKARLQQTTQTFNSALSFPMPPSLLTSTASSLISISGPEASASLSQDEEKGQAAIRNLRYEIAELLLLDSDPRGSEGEGELKARRRVSDLRETISVWKGTGEEKARTKIADGLETMIDEAAEKRRRRNVPPNSGARGQDSLRRQADPKIQEEPQRSGTPSVGPTKGGFLGGLQRLRDEFNMD